MVMHVLGESEVLCQSYHHQQPAPIESWKSDQHGRQNTVRRDAGNRRREIDTEGGTVLPDDFAELGLGNVGPLLLADLAEGISDEACELLGTCNETEEVEPEPYRLRWAPARVLRIHAVVLVYV